MLASRDHPRWQCSLETIPSLSIEGSRITPVPVEEVGESLARPRSERAIPVETVQLRTLAESVDPRTRSVYGMRAGHNARPSQPFPREAGP